MGNAKRERHKFCVVRPFLEPHAVDPRFPFPKNIHLCALCGSSVSFFDLLTRVVGVVALSAALLWPTAPARAQDEGQAQPPIEIEAPAREELENGRRLMKQGDFVGAARALQRAFVLAPPDSALSFEADTDWHETLPRTMVRALVARGETEQALRLVDDALAATADHPRHREILGELRSTVVALQKATAQPVDEKKYSRLASEALDEFRRREGRYPAGVPETREALARAGVLAHYAIVDYRVIGAGYQLALRAKAPGGGTINLRTTGLLR
jgi:tetratricopeptide (TPR) repeat protein